jgi:hypothetical protein
MALTATSACSSPRAVGDPTRLPDETLADQNLLGQIDAVAGACSRCILDRLMLTDIPGFGWSPARITPIERKK